MRKWAIGLLALFTLTGCLQKEEIERGMALRSDLLRSGGSFNAQIVADYGDKSYTFGMFCEFDDTGDMSFTVTAPDTIAGIQGTIADNAGNLTFDDTALHFELMADGYLSPISAPWVFLKTLRSGYLTSAGEEEEGLRLSLDDSYEEDALHLDIWLNEQNIPLRAEILFDGRRILSMEVVNFAIL